MTELELRYRRLLAWYPVDFRTAYEEEMVGVLMESSREGQRYPQPREAVSLAAAAVRRRLGVVAGSLVDRRWADAAAVVGVLAPLVLLAERSRVALGWVVMYLDLRAMDIQMTPYPLIWSARLAVPALAMSVVVVLALTGWRVAAAVAAWTAVAGQIGLLGLGYTRDPVHVVYETVPLVLAVTAAAALSVPNPGARGRTLLGWPRVGLAVTAGALWVASGMSIHGYALLAPNGMDGLAVGVALVFGGGLLWHLLRRTEPGVRRRVLALIAPTGLAILLVKFGFGGFIESSPRFYPTPVLLVPGQWLALVVTPLLVFAVGVLLVRRADEIERLVDLGRAAERPVPATPGGGPTELFSADE